MNDIVIFGAGGLAREVAWLLDSPDTKIVWPGGDEGGGRLIGHLDDDGARHGSTVNGRVILGGSDWLRAHPEVGVVIAVGNCAARQAIACRLRELGAEFPTVLAAGTVIGECSSVDQGGIVLPGVVITTNVRVGAFALLNPHVSISHDGVIGDYCSLGPGVKLAGSVQVGAGSDIGTNASAIPGAWIGERCVIGAGAVVVQPIPDRSTAVGVPARVICSRES